MNKIRALPSRQIQEILFPTIGTYSSLLVANASNIKPAIESRQTYSFGSNDRQKLDVYLPKTKTNAPRQKVLMFVYGGGFVNGDRTLAPPPFQGLVHGNIGHFFSQHGFTVVIPDYRLLGGQHGEVKFPSGGEDVSLAVEWALQNSDKMTTLAGTGVDLFILGNSAGGIHTSTFLLHNDFASTRAKAFAADGNVKLRGIGLLGAPFDFQDADAGLLGNVTQYYGDQYEQYTPLALLKAKSNEADWVKAGAKVIILNSEMDPQHILDANDRFEKLYESKYGKVDGKTIDGHNHISVILGTGTGLPEEEAWANDLAEWVKKVD